VRLLDPESLREVAPGEEGMIACRRTTRALPRVLEPPEETAKVKRGGWFLTGDYARYDEDGYLWFLGRRDDIIKSFGYRVSPYEVERVLKGHPAVADCAVRRGGRRAPTSVIVVAYVIRRPGAQVSPDELLAFGASISPRTKRPRPSTSPGISRARRMVKFVADITPRIAIARSSA
jgi:acyl-coenzyme A synthetase/AMP-(fatty) acid ligase